MRSSARLPFMLAALSLLSAFIFAPHPPKVYASGPGLVISAVYGGGGNSGKPDWSHDYVELFNAGNMPISLSGWSIQYAAAGQTTWNNKTNLPPVRLLPGQYFLVQEGTSTSGGGAPLPSPDFVNSADPRHLSSTSHKVALFRTTTRYTDGTNPIGDPHLADLLGYGISNAYEGSGPAPIINTEKQSVRKQRGCRDTNDNASDFKTVDHFTPRNSKSRLQPCGVGKQLLTNSDFNADTNGDSIPDKWLVKNRTQDQTVCNSSGKRVSFAGKCAFQFTGGSGESAVLQQDVSIANQTFAPGDHLVLSAYLKAKNSAASMRIILKVKYVGTSTPAKVTRTVGAVGAYTHITVPALTLTGGNVKRVIVQFKNNSSSGKLWIDGAMLLLEKSGRRDSVSELLEVPPPAN